MSASDYANDVRRTYFPKKGSPVASSFLLLGLPEFSNIQSCLLAAAVLVPGINREAGAFQPDWDRLCLEAPR